MFHNMLEKDLKKKRKKHVPKLTYSQEFLKLEKWTNNVCHNTIKCIQKEG